MLKRSVIIFAVLLAFSLILISGISGCAPTGTIKIGFISPMSGQAAAYGAYVQKAFQIGVDEWNLNHNLKIEAILWAIMFICISSKHTKKILSDICFNLSNDALSISGKHDPQTINES